jgi:hypothetical protein
MNISPQLAGVATAATTRVSANGANNVRSAATNGATQTAPAASASSTNTDAGPAARVTISNKARAQLKAAGVSPNEIAKINLNDKNAVARAIQKARMSRGKPIASASNATNAGAATAKPQQLTAAGPSSGVTKPDTQTEDAPLGDDADNTDLTGGDAAETPRKSA